MTFREMMDIVTDGHAVLGTLALVLATAGICVVVMLSSAIWG